MKRIASLPLLVFALLVTAIAAASAPALSARQGSRLPPGTASISGRVVAVESGKPIQGATVEIVIYNNTSSRFQQVTTNEDGLFTFKDLPAGKYQLAASAQRYVRMQYGAPEPGPVGLLNPAGVIDLTDGQAFTKADFTLPPFSAIEGTVLDEFGDPVPNVMVQVSQVTFAGGRKRLMPANPSSEAGPAKPTDDRGHFRIAGLAPGDYYVEALSGAFANPTAAGGFAVTFFPGTTKTSSAQAVRLAPGRDVLNLSFALSPAAMADVSGTLVDGDGQPIKGGNMMLMPSERSGAPLFAMVRAIAGDGGRFAFRNVPPGLYTIQAFGMQVGTGGNLGAMAFGYLTFPVEGKSIDDLKVVVPTPRNLRGRITFEGGTSTPKPGNGSYVATYPVEFESAPIGGGPPPSHINDDWTFEVNALSGLRRVRANVPPNWTTKRIMVGGRDVLDQPLDFREHDVNDVEIVLTQETTRITGTVKLTDGQPVAGRDVIVFAEDETKWGPWSRYVGWTRSSDTGAFSVGGLGGGMYVAVAVDSMISGEWQDPEFLTKQRGNPSAKRFTLLDGGSATVDIVVVR